MRSASTDFAALPVTTKTDVLADFARFNVAGISLDEALSVAMQAEHSRDFSPRVQDWTVGLSSGTSGRRGVFLVSDAERMLWVGIVLGSLLRPPVLRQLLTPWRPPVRIGFLLRSDSNLYRTVVNRRVAFDFHDLFRPFAETLASLQQSPPDLLVAPSSVLLALAEQQRSGGLRITPQQVVAVAEVLEPTDREAIEAAFRVQPDQVYQATEGLLGITCGRGMLHLNERHVFFEREWLDAERTRFVPIITDLTRQTQKMWRYRLDDVLRVGPACPCGNPAQVIAQIEGRADEVLEIDGTTIFPDLVRRAMALASAHFADWTITTRAEGLEVSLREPGPGAAGAVQEQLGSLWHTIGVRAPALSFVPWVPGVPGSKRIRIRRGA